MSGRTTPLSRPSKKHPPRLLQTEVSRDEFNDAMIVYLPETLNEHLRLQVLRSQLADLHRTNFNVRRENEQLKTRSQDMEKRLAEIEAENERLRRRLEVQRRREEMSKLAHDEMMKGVLDTVLKQMDRCQLASRDSEK